jgi:hypothetical protein
MSSLFGGLSAGGESVREPELADAGAPPVDSAVGPGGDGGDDGDDGDGSVNYDEAAVVELELSGTDYRVDVGRAGTALCISTRPSGSWSWVFRGEARWQNNVLRCKAFDRGVLTQLSQALAEAATDSQS